MALKRPTPLDQLRRKRAASAAAATARDDAPLSRRVLGMMLLVVAALGYIITSESEIPRAVLISAGALGLLGLFLVGLGRPEIPLYLMVAYLPFSKQLAGDFGGFMTAFNLTNLLLIIILFGWLSGTSTGQQPAFEGHAMHLPVFLIMLWGFASMWATVGRIGMWYFGHTLPEFKRWLDPIIIYFFFFHLIQNKQRWKNIVVIMMLSVVMVALMAIWEYLDVSNAGSLEGARVYGIADNPNSLGAFFVYYMFLFAAFWLQRLGEWRRWLLLGPLLLCFRGIMVTFSRGAYLAFALGSLALAFLRSKVLFFFACGALAFTLTNPWILPEGIRYRLMESTFKNRNVELLDAYSGPGLEQRMDTSAAVRFVIWDGAKRMIAEYPIFGIGLNNFQNVILRYVDLDRAYDAHNAYLLAASEQGLPMLVFFILLLLMVGWTAYRVYVRTDDAFIKATALAVFAGVAGLSLANMFGSRMNSMEVSGYFWMYAALMARADVWITAEERTTALRERDTRRQALKRKMHTRFPQRGR
jgi:O-antigen ligase